MEMTEWMKSCYELRPIVSAVATVLRISRWPAPDLSVSSSALHHPMWFHSIMETQINVPLKAKPKFVDEPHLATALATKRAEHKKMDK